MAQIQTQGNKKYFTEVWRRRSKCKGGENKRHTLTSVRKWVSCHTAYWHVAAILQKATSFLINKSL